MELSHQSKEDLLLGDVETTFRDASARHDRPFMGITSEAMEILEGHDWPGNVRELRNLVESMVVLAPGRRIAAQDIPAEIRSPRSRGLLPAPLMRPLEVARHKGESLRPELEFVFRTLMSLRMDIEDLRRDFQHFKEEHEVAGREIQPFRLTELAAASPRLREIFHQGMGEGDGDRLEAEGRESGDAAGSDLSAPSPGRGWEEGEQGAVLYRPGMTMDEVEEQTIRAVLEEVRGNRRKAAERLGIGERTLYRKIKKYGLEE